MSIIEETLRKLQAKQTDNDKPAIEEKISKGIKSRTRPFVMILIALFVLGLGSYMAIDLYQEKLNERNENLGYETSYPNTEILSVVENQKAPIILEPDGKPKSVDPQPDVPRQLSPVLSVRPSQLPVLDNQISGPLDKDVQVDDINSIKTTGKDESNQNAESPPTVNAHNVEPELNEIVLENEHKKSDEKTGSADSSVLNQVSLTDIVSEPELEFDPEPKLKHDIDEEQTSESVNQLTENTLSSEPVENLKDPEPSPAAASLLVEEYAVKRQLDRARDLITAGSYAEATNILKTVIDRSRGTWEAYLLIGTAYLGSGELDYAEAYLDMGFAINANIPQLWLQRAIVEQQRGDHKTALQFLHEAERIAPDIPEVQLNIGYSNDVIGNNKLSAKAYSSFIKLTDGNLAYITVRHKVLQRLQHLK